MLSRFSQITLSIASWLCLWSGLAALGLLAIASRVAEWRQADRLVEAELSRLEHEQVRLVRLERLTTAVKENAVFRDEWMRREWGLHRDGLVELVDVEGSLKLSPTSGLSDDSAVGQQSHRSTNAWEHFVDLERLGGDRTLMICGLALLGIGLLGPLLPATKPRPVLRGVAARVLARYRPEPEVVAEPPPGPTADVAA